MLVLVQISSHGGLSLAHMAWVTAMAINGERLLDFYLNNQLLITNTCFKHKSIHKATWFRNGNRSRPGHIIDYILVNRCSDHPSLTPRFTSQAYMFLIMS